MKTAEPDCLLRIESSSAGFQALLCELLWRTCLDSIALHAAVSGIESGAEHVRKGLNDFSSFLQVKALCNFTLGSYPFPTLLCFIICIVLFPHKIFKGFFLPTFFLLSCMHALLSSHLSQIFLCWYCP